MGDARRDELLREIKELPIPVDLPGDQVARFEATERPAFTKAIETWGTERRALLSDLAKCVEDTSPSQQQTQRWIERVQRAQDAYSSSISAVTSSGVSSVIATGFAARTSQAERAFLGALTAMQTVAASRDFIIAYRDSVSQRRELLET